MNQQYESPILPSGLPLNVEDVLVENSKEELSRSICSHTEFIPSVHHPDGHYIKQDSSKKFRDVFGSQVRSDIDIDESIPILSDDELLPIAPTHYELLSPNDNAAIHAVWTFLKSYPTCIYNFIQHDFEWKCSLLDNFSTIGFSIRLLKNINKNSVLIEFRRTSGCSHIFHGLVHSFPLHLTEFHPMISIISNCRHINNIEIKRRKICRDMPLTNVPEVTPVELAASLVAVCNWLESSTNQAVSVNSSNQPTVGNQVGNTVVEDYRSLSDAIQVGALITHYQHSLLRGSSCNDYSVSNNTQIHMNSTRTTTKHPRAYGDCDKNMDCSCDISIPDATEKVLQCTVNAIHRTTTAEPCPSMLRPHPHLLHSLHTQTALKPIVL